MSLFKDKVLSVCSKIPTGKVMSYGQVATIVGVPRAAIQVGWILHEFGDTVCWWRIINHKGFISTKCPEHTPLLQKSLLEKEGIVVSKKMRIDIAKYRYLPSEKELNEFGLSPDYIEMIVEKYLL